MSGNKNGNGNGNGKPSLLDTLKMLFKGDNSGETYLRHVIESLDMDSTIPLEEARKKAHLSKRTVCATLSIQAMLDLSFLGLHMLLEFGFYLASAVVTLWAGYRVFVQGQADVDFLLKLLFGVLTFIVGALARRGANIARNRLAAVQAAQHLLDCRDD
ncbi:hypothetical protein ACH5A7_12900 [Streptomyces sp. NPDC018955]|uniref:hypothetical protein n=1 Tax=Streptomyces sp. NPDC018955 TaxID=3365055 RepID=UPI0037A1F8FE